MEVAYSSLLARPIVSQDSGVRSPVVSQFAKDGKEHPRVITYAIPAIGAQDY